MKTAVAPATIDLDAAVALTMIAPERQIPSPVVPYVETNPVSVLLDEDLRARFFDEIRAEIDVAPVDLETKKGRDAIKSLAYKIARTKTAIDDAGKKLNEERRKQINAVDERRRDCKTKLEALQTQARKPLDDWETAEKERENAIKQTLEFIDGARTILATDTSAVLKGRLAQVEAIEGDEFTDAKAFAVKTLSTGIERLEKEEADRAELARLRAEQAERDRVEAERKAAEQREREEAERKAREEKLVQERAEAAAKQAAEEAVAAERRKAEEALAEQRRAADEAARKEREAHEAELARIAAEKRKLEEAEAARLAEETRLADEQAARERDKKHRSTIMGAAKVAILCVADISEEQAKAIVLAITSGKIPNVSIKF